MVIGERAGFRRSVKRPFATRDWGLGGEKTPSASRCSAPPPLGRGRSAEVLAVLVVGVCMVRPFRVGDVCGALVGEL